MTVRYVSASGSDSNDGLSAENPFETVEHAKSVSELGDALCLMDGMAMDPELGDFPWPPPSKIGEYDAISFCPCSNAWTFVGRMCIS